jgi:hypothetical protein
MDIAICMEILHEKKIVYFNLKSENLLLSLKDPQRLVCKVLVHSWQTTKLILYKLGEGGGGGGALPPPPLTPDGGNGSISTELIIVLTIVSLILDGFAVVFVNILLKKWCV